MQASPGLGGGIDGNALRSLRAQATSDPRAAVQQAAKQFEALFMQELLKSMRSATMSSGLLDNSGTAMGTELLDGQFAQKLTGLPGGLSSLSPRWGAYADFLVLWLPPCPPRSPRAPASS